MSDNPVRLFNYTPLVKESSLKVGDMVAWNSSGGTARGKITNIKRDGILNIPDTDFKINATKEEPAALIRLYRNDKPTDTLVGHKLSTLRKQ